jgi:hypothetical protein
VNLRARRLSCASLAPESERQCSLIFNLQDRMLPPQDAHVHQQGAGGLTVRSPTYVPNTGSKSTCRK